MSPRTVALRVAMGLTCSVVATVAAAQGVSLDVSAGRIVYEPLSANTATNNASATLRVDSSRGLWVFGTTAMPLGSSDSRWTAGGAGGRILHSIPSTRVNIGADVNGQGFLFRDAVLNQGGSGGLIEAIPFVQVPAGAASVEVRGGWRAHTLSYAGAVDRNNVFETGVRAAYGVAARVQGDARWVRANGAVYPFFGGTMAYERAPLQFWLRAGRWFSPTLTDASWGGGAAVNVAERLTVWAGVQQDAPDPLYWNLSRKSWSVGVTHRFGETARATQLVSQSSHDAAGVLIRLDAGDVNGATVSIAGDFNGWQPVPMEREGREWRVRLPLAPGVYHYAFRSDRGQWFVPASVPNRRDDGMGGYVAVLVVG